MLLRTVLLTAFIRISHQGINHRVINTHYIKKKIVSRSLKGIRNPCYYISDLNLDVNSGWSFQVLFFPTIFLRGIYAYIYHDDEARNDLYLLLQTLHKTVQIISLHFLVPWECVKIVIAKKVEKVKELVYIHTFGILWGFMDVKEKRFLGKCICVV